MSSSSSFLDVISLNNSNKLTSFGDESNNTNTTNGKLLSSSYDQTRIYGTRKGKWTIEEEKYTKKVIETFNKGTLPLSPDDKNITLRAYLADKLDCDPMRITKKYTGDSCLGKRVFRSDINIDDRDEAVVNDRLELEKLERDFRLKLQQQSRNKGRTTNNFNFTTNSHQQEYSPIISTPAIDALVLQSRRQAQVTSSTNSSGQRSKRVSPQSVLKEMPLQMQHMTHDQLLGQLTEEAAQVLRSRRQSISSSSSSSSRQLSRDFHGQTHGQQGQQESEEDDLAHRGGGGGRRAQYQSREEQHQQRSQWQRRQQGTLGNRLSSRGELRCDDDVLTARIQPGYDAVTYQQNIHNSSYHAHSPATTSKRVKLEAGGEDDDGTDTAVLSLLNFHSTTPQQMTCSSTMPPLTQRLLCGEPRKDGEDELRLWEASARLLSELASSGSSCCSGSEGGEDSDMSELSTQAVAGCV